MKFTYRYIKYSVQLLLYFQHIPHYCGTTIPLVRVYTEIPLRHPFRGQPVGTQ